MVARAQNFGRAAIPFIKKDIVSAAKQALFEIAAPEIGGVVSRRKKLKTI